MPLVNCGCGVTYNDATQSAQCPRHLPKVPPKTPPVAPPVENAPAPVNPPLPIAPTPILKATAKVTPPPAPKTIGP